MARDGYRAFGIKDVRQPPLSEHLNAEQQRELEILAHVFPFRVSRYVIEHLIDWNRIPEDPIYQMTFPQRGMLSSEQFEQLEALVEGGAATDQIEAVARNIQYGMNPNPAGQKTDNVPIHDGHPVQGLQHKYRETVLFFPTPGQVCHSYCTYCFRWSQFVGLSDLRFAARSCEELVSYLTEHPEVTDLLVTGGDPLTMKTSVLRKFIDPILTPQLAHVKNIRFGTKALSYWPQRFCAGEDADELLSLFDDIIKTQRNIALMAHFSHPREIATTQSQLAVQRLRNTGVVIRSQSPIIKHVNNCSRTWRDLWKAQVSLGIVPYYMFIERDTGARQYFEVPLYQALDIYRNAYANVSGLARTVRGPVMSMKEGKLLLVDVISLLGEKYFLLQYIQSRNLEDVGITFVAKFDTNACWVDGLVLNRLDGYDLSDRKSTSPILDSITAQPNGLNAAQIFALAEMDTSIDLLI